MRRLVCGRLIAKFWTCALSGFPTIDKDNLFKEKPEDSFRLSFLICAFILSFRNTFNEIFALKSRTSTCLALNFPGVSGISSMSKRKFPCRINIVLKRRSIFGLGLGVVSLRANASMTNCRFNGSDVLFLLKWTVGPNNRMVLNTSRPSNKGNISNPADT